MRLLLKRLIPLVCLGVSAAALPQLRAQAQPSALPATALPATAPFHDPDGWYEVQFPAGTPKVSTTEGTRLTALMTDRFAYVVGDMSASADKPYAADAPGTALMGFLDSTKATILYRSDKPQPGQTGSPDQAPGAPIMVVYKMPNGLIGQGLYLAEPQHCFCVSIISRVQGVDPQREMSDFLHSFAILK